MLLRLTNFGGFWGVPCADPIVSAIGRHLIIFKKCEENVNADIDLLSTSCTTV